MILCYPFLLCDAILNVHLIELVKVLRKFTTKLLYTVLEQSKIPHYATTASSPSNNYYQSPDSMHMTVLEVQTLGPPQPNSAANPYIIEQETTLLHLEVGSRNEESVMLRRAESFCEVNVQRGTHVSFVVKYEYIRHRCMDL